MTKQFNLVLAEVLQDHAKFIASNSSWKIAKILGYFMLNDNFNHSVFGSSTNAHG